ncbi:MAG: hemolysin III family protein [Gemmatimonadaceae bacterium]
MRDRALTIGEEIANSLTHGVGLLASVIAFPVLLIRAQSSSDSAAVAGAAIFGATLILAYATSTIYHALPISKGKQLFRVLDHSAIYLLIAGTYTPFALGPLRGPWGWTLLGVIWALALIGIVSKLTIGFRLPRLSTGLYLLMGWLIVVAIKPLVETIPREGLLWLAAGGLAYTGGVVFYHMKHVRYAHMIWHLCVAAGSLCHFIAVLRYAIKA